MSSLGPGGAELGRDDWFCLVRGSPVPDGRPALLKRSLRRPPAGEVLAALRREYEILCGLDIPGVLRPLAFLDDEALLVLEDVAGIPLPALLAGKPLPPREVLDVALRLAGTLGELHHRGIVHRALSPAAVLIEPASRELWLHDFVLASRLPEETPGILPAHAFRRRLAYMAPEETGRMNRVVDYRTDFYSLGVILYEMLAGRPPFASEDPLEVVHAHIARTPPSPTRLDPAIPEPLSAVVMKLLAKTAEERYQSAAGLKADLKAVESACRDAGAPASFRPGTRDVSARFSISQRLYGRDPELAALLAAFERAGVGPAGLMLVSGYSGVGKSSLVAEVHKPIVRRKGRFLTGKFDQLDRNVPYGALLQAFRGLVRQILAEDEDTVSTIRQGLLDALGPNGGVMTGVLPELELVIGPQPPVPPLGPTESQNRFHYVFQSFLGVFARPMHPLVVFLDDLQWADVATLRLLALLLTHPDVTHLFVIGAYRDNEVSSDHVLVRTLAEMRASGARIDEIVLAPLGLPDVQRLVGDALHGEDAAVEALARLVLAKTNGNPFFVRQFLHSLAAGGLVTFDHASGAWSFDLAEIEKAGITENVVDLMRARLKRLAPVTRQTLILASAVGNTFPLATLAVVAESSLSGTATNLWEAIEQGLVLPLVDRYELLAMAPDDVLARVNPSFRFLHDRVQQAAYELIPKDEERPVHLKVGRLLRAQFGETVPADRLFEIVHHLNVAAGLVTAESERADLLRLNLAAGRKAKESAAFPAALAYFEAGLSLLPDDPWRTRYEAARELNREAAEAHYLCGRFGEAERTFDLLLRELRTPVEKADVHRMRIVQYENMARYADAVRVGREALALFGVALPVDDDGKAAALEVEMGRIEEARGGRPIETLESLPDMVDPETRAVVSLLTAIWAPAYIAGDRLMPSLLSALMVRLSLERGNTEESAYGYVTHAITVGTGRGDFRAGHDFGRLALKVNERFHDLKRRAKVHHMFSCFVNLWRRPLATCFPHSREAFRVGVETGDFTYATYGVFHESWYAFLSGMELLRFEREYTPSLAFLRRIKNDSFADVQQVLLAWGRAFRGETASPTSLSDESFDEAAYEERYAGNAFFLTFFYVVKLHLAVAFEDLDAAGRLAAKAREVVAALTGTVWGTLLAFLEGRTAIALADAAPEGNRGDGLAAPAPARETLRIRAENCPENFRVRHLLLEAEAARLAGDRRAMGLFEEAIAAAEAMGALPDQALAFELYARFWSRQGHALLARPLLRTARERYRRWGALAKVRALEERHGELLDDVLSAGAVTEAATGGGLDLATVLKAARAIASEIELEKLLKTLVRIAVENAGAERGVLLEERSGRLWVVADGAAADDTPVVLSETPLEERTDLPRSVLYLVHHTGESVLVGDAGRDPRWLEDPYVDAARPRSILCVPIESQGRRRGLLYLENNLAADAFTAERAETMTVLCASAAISLENARLYEATRREVERRREAEEALRAALGEVGRLKDRLEAENVYLQEEIRTQHNFEEIVGNSPRLLEALRKVEKVATTDTTVLLLGETGTGKELFARALHSRSRRAGRPLVKVNCGAIPLALVESELFGHVKGAFTGALQNRLGRFELADKGTIFLDEIGELPLETQVKLLRVLQEREFEAVGSARTLRVDVRVIAATNRNLEEAVRNGTFRADLLYRLNVFPITAPPLRDRKEDIPLLVGFFLAGLSRRLGKPLEGFSRRSMERLVASGWPGNVRELENVVERAAIVAAGPILELEEGGATVSGAEGEAAQDLESVERAHIEAVLRSTRGVVEGPRGAAAVLKLHPNTLRSRMKKLGIIRGSHDIS